MSSKYWRDVLDGRVRGKTVMGQVAIYRLESMLDGMPGDPGFERQKQKIPPGPPRHSGLTESQAREVMARLRRHTEENSAVSDDRNDGDDDDHRGDVSGQEEPRMVAVRSGAVHWVRSRSTGNIRKMDGPRLYDSDAWELLGTSGRFERFLDDEDDDWNDDDDGLGDDDEEIHALMSMMPVEGGHPAESLLLERSMEVVHQAFSPELMARIREGVKMVDIHRFAESMADVRITAIVPQGEKRMLRNRETGELRIFSGPTTYDPAGWELFRIYRT